MLMKEREGRVIGTDLLYESIVVPYSVGRGRPRRYVVDFYDLVEAVAYEVKPRKRRKTRTNIAKAAAAEAHLTRRGIEYRIVDEGSIPPLSRREAGATPGVVISRRRRRKR